MFCMEHLLCYTGGIHASPFANPDASTIAGKESTSTQGHGFRAAWTVTALHTYSVQQHTNVRHLWEGCYSKEQTSQDMPVSHGPS